METILSVLRFSIRPSSETHALIARGISWKEIIAVLFAGVVVSMVINALLRVSLGIEVDLISLGSQIISTTLSTVVFATLLYVFCKIFKGKGDFRIHIGVFAWVSIPVNIILAIGTAVIVLPGVSFFVYPIIMLMAVGWGLILISKSNSIVHEFSETRTTFAFVATGIVIYVIQMFLPSNLWGGIGAVDTTSKSPEVGSILRNSDELLKAKDDSVRITLSGAVPQAEIYHDLNNSYLDLCTKSSIYKSDVDALPSFNCKDSSTAYAMSASLTDRTFWCVDSTGAQRSIISSNTEAVCSASPVNAAFDFVGKQICISAPDLCNEKDAYIILNKRNSGLVGQYSYPVELARKSQWNYWGFVGSGEFTIDNSQIFKFQESDWSNPAKPNDYWLMLAGITDNEHHNVNDYIKEMTLLYRNPLTGTFEATRVPTMPGLVTIDSVTRLEENVMQVVASDGNGTQHTFILLLRNLLGINEGPDLGHRFLWVSTSDLSPNGYSKDEQDLFYRYGWRKFLSN